MSKQKLSLQEQLLKSGLVSVAKAKTVKTDKRKQDQQQRKNNVAVVDEAKELALQAKAEQVERDRLLNQQKQQQEQQKQLQAQVKELIELNKQPQDADGIAYHFNDHNKMKTLYVSSAMREQLVKGRSAIVKFEGGGYEVVSSDVAQKLRLRDARSVIVDNAVSAADEGGKDDPYADFQIPDDLLW